MTEILQTTPMRPAETNTRPRFTLPARACDAHFHVFEPGFPHVPDPLYTFPDGTLEQYLRMAAVLGIERMVLVQPTFYGTDNRLLAEVLRRLGPDRGGHQRRRPGPLSRPRGPGHPARPVRPQILADRGHHRLRAADGGAGRAPRLAHPVLHTRHRRA